MAKLPRCCSFVPSAPPVLSRMQGRKWRWDSSERLLTSCCCRQNRLILRKTTCCQVKWIQGVRNKKESTKATPSLPPFPSSASLLHFWLLYSHPGVLFGGGGGEGGLWSVHNCFSLLPLPPPIFRLLWCGIFTGCRGICSSAWSCCFSSSGQPLASPCNRRCPHVGVYIWYIHKCQNICFIKPTMDL